MLFMNKSTLKNLVESIPPPWDGARLGLAKKSELSVLLKSNVYIKGWDSKLANERILEIFGGQNAELAVEKWDVFYRNEELEGTLFVIGFDQKSMASLAKNKGRAYFASKSVIFKMGKVPIGRAVTTSLEKDTKKPKTTASVSTTDNRGGNHSPARTRNSNALQNWKCVYIVLDITICSKELINEIQYWRVSDMHSFSDHRYIRFKILRSPPKPIKFRNKSKTNWAMFGTLLKNRLGQDTFQCRNKEDIDAKVETFTNGALVYRRLHVFAQDHSSSLEAIKEFLNKHNFVKKFALFQCTSVFLKEKYIIEAVHKFNFHPCVFAAKRSHKLRWKQLGTNLIIPLNFNPFHRPRRQDWDGELDETGMFYFATKQLVNKNSLQNNRCAIVEVDAQDAVEIDNMNDLKMAQCMLK
ncbi:hypothetical protein FF38_04219 [Lucilia cuprina]|uniref:DUF4780 domain-containing protein n=1 Tax=Lucilia cuprina TaxID=7375 RepID=A0A0L0BLT1_LUCCU|nr:hypothetical protein FF38_04219 [Lucilia cuprina]